MVAINNMNIEFKKIDITVFSSLAEKEPELLNLICTLEREIILSNMKEIKNMMVRVKSNVLSLSDYFKRLANLQLKIYHRYVKLKNIIGVFGIFEGYPLQSAEGRVVWNQYIKTFIRFCRIQNVIAEECSRM